MTSDEQRRTPKSRTQTRAFFCVKKGENQNDIVYVIILLKIVKMYMPEIQRLKQLYFIVMLSCIQAGDRNICRRCEFRGINIMR